MKRGDIIWERVKESKSLNHEEELSVSWYLFLSCNNPENNEEQMEFLAEQIEENCQRVKQSRWNDCLRKAYEIAFYQGDNIRLDNHNWYIKKKGWQMPKTIEGVH